MGVTATTHTDAARRGKGCRPLAHSFEAGLAAHVLQRGVHGGQRSISGLIALSMMPAFGLTFSVVFAADALRSLGLSYFLSSGIILAKQLLANNLMHKRVPRREAILATGSNIRKRPSATRSHVPRGVLGDARPQ